MCNCLNRILFITYFDFFYFHIRFGRERSGAEAFRNRLFISKHLQLSRWPREPRPYSANNNSLFASKATLSEHHIKLEHCREYSSYLQACWYLQIDPDWYLVTVGEPAKFRSRWWGWKEDQGQRKAEESLEHIAAAFMCPRQRLSMLLSRWVHGGVSKQCSAWYSRKRDSCCHVEVAPVLV